MRRMFCFCCSKPKIPRYADANVDILASAEFGNGDKVDSPHQGEHSSDEQSDEDIDEHF